MRYTKTKYKKGIWTEKKAKGIYSLIAMGIGLSGGTLIFHGLVFIFRILGFESSFGHGEILVAAILFNLIVGVVLVIVGRIIISWRKLSW